MSRRNTEIITAVTSSKPNFLHVSLCATVVIFLDVLHFTLVTVIEKPSEKVRSALMWSWHISELGTLLIVWVPNMIIVGPEFGATFVQRDCMSEVADKSVGSCKWEGTRHYSDRADRIPTPCYTLSAKLTCHVENRTYHTPTNSISTSIENAFLNALLCFHPVSSSRLNILYTKGICWWSPAGRRPTCDRSS